MKLAWKRVMFVLKFWKFIPFIKEYYVSKEIDKKYKIWPVLYIIAYFALPIDIIPDVFGIFGLTDDVLFTTFILQRLVKTATPRLQEKYNLNNEKII